MTRQEYIDKLWRMEEVALHTYEKRHLRAVIAELEAMTDEEWLHSADRQEE